MAYVETPGAYFTWDSSTFTWDAPESNKTWDESYPFSAVLTVDETLHFTEVNPKTFTPATFTEAVAFAEAYRWSATKLANEPLNFAENYSGLTGFNLSFNESVYFLEASRKTLSVAYAEAFSFTEARTSNFTLRKAETVTFFEVETNVVDFARTFGETLIVADAIAKTHTARKTESFHFLEQYHRQGPVVVTNFVIRDDTLTYAQFIDKVQNNIPLDYGPFRPFIPGDYDMSKALIKITMRRDNTGQDLRLIDGIVYADVPDVNDQGIANVPATPTTPLAVTFNRKFYAPPTIIITSVSAAVAVSPVVANITKTGFTVDLRDSSNVHHAGTAFWQARGY